GSRFYENEVERMMHELDMRRDLRRVIVHVDMDAFYAAVEMRDCPELKDKPMAVGSMSMLSTSNYHARKFGVRAGMPGFIAKKLCPNLVIVPTNFDKYRAVSTEIREIFAEYDPHVQPMSLDEAYLDFTDHLEQRISWPESLRTHCLRTDTSGTGQPQHLAMPACLWGNGCAWWKLRGVWNVRGGSRIAPNTMLAKVCSDKNKPNGQYRLPSNREAVMDFIQNLPVHKSSLHHSMRISLGLGSTHLERDGERKSKSTERTFKEMSVAEEQLSLCRELCEDLAADMKKGGLRDLLKTEIENVSPQRLRLRLMGVWISTFVSADDKKPQQKSIMGFLQQGSSGPSQGFASNRGKETVSHPCIETEPPACGPSPEQQPHLVPRLQGLPWTAGQTALQVGVAGGHPSIASVASVRLAPPEASASTSGCSAANPDTLTCPVCFSEVRTTDLNMFNRRIDRCLGGVYYRCTTDTDSESGGEGGLEGSTAKAEPIEEQGDDGERRKNAHLEGSTLICPVCRVPQNTEDLALFNRHVDLCLNQEVLHELGEHSSSSGAQPPITDKRSKGYERDQHTARPSKGKSKRPGPPSSPPTKKAKTLGSQNTIDKFFR
ncbi:hypothetical protein NHX12_034475, partial [Muraenolepis orangiensis]